MQWVYSRSVRFTFFLFAMLSGPVFAQLVQIGPNDPNYCYKIEKIRPNFEVRDQVRVVGRVQDETVFPFVSSRVELRRYISQRKQVSVRVVSTDATGHFDLGIVKSGKYRLLASPNRGFKQPSALQCQNGDTCELEITLIANPTDMPDSPCPIR
jgi:hypothetical protein